MAESNHTHTHTNNTKMSNKKSRNFLMKIDSGSLRQTKRNKIKKNSRGKKAAIKSDSISHVVFDIYFSFLFASFRR